MHWKCRSFNKKMFYQTYCARLANKRRHKTLKFSEKLTNHVDLIVFPKCFEDLCFLSQQRCNLAESELLLILPRCSRLQLNNAALLIPPLLHTANSTVHLASAAPLLHRRCAAAAPLADPHRL